MRSSFQGPGERSRLFISPIRKKLVQMHKTCWYVSEIRAGSVQNALSTQKLNVHSAQNTNASCQ